MTAEELVQPDLDVVVLEHHRLADGQNPIARGPFGFAGATIRAD